MQPRWALTTESRDDAGTGRFVDAETLERVMEMSSINLVALRARAAAIALALPLAGSLGSSLLVPAWQAAHAAVVSVTVRERLSNYGGWRTSNRFGEVWVPSVRSEWRPYTEGRWVWTDEGWYWHSAEPFGAIVYHYGRWAYDPEFGWVWIVGDEWAPAWVVWRQGADDIGWAPAPPPELDVAYDDGWWSFAPVAAIGAADLVTVVRPVRENVTIIRNTTIINQTVVVNNAPRVRLGNQVVAINAGPRLQRLPPSVVTSIKAAKVVPPRKGVFAEARLDPSKGEAIKRLNGNAISAAPAIANVPDASGQGPKKLPGGKVFSPAGSVAEAVQNPHDNKRKRMTAGNNVEARMPQAHGGRHVHVQSAPGKVPPQQRLAHAPKKQFNHQQMLAMHAPQHHGPQRGAPHRPPMAKKVQKCDPRVSHCKPPR